MDRKKKRSPPPAFCTGIAKETLELFRIKQREIQALGRAKPDMIAYKELRFRHTPERSYGMLPGIPIGLRLEGRGEAAILGIHTKILSGIDAIKDESCYAVCLSGGYIDDEAEDSEGGKTFYYTGEGGRKGKRQVTDQVENVSNASLMMSVRTKLPIRLLRGGPTKRNGILYAFEGLYRCVGFTYEPSLDGPKVFKFELRPINCNNILDNHDFTAMSKSHSRKVKSEEQLVVDSSAPIIKIEDNIEDDFKIMKLHTKHKSEEEESHSTSSSCTEATSTAKQLEDTSFPTVKIEEGCYKEEEHKPIVDKYHHHNKSESNTTTTNFGDNNNTTRGIDTVIKNDDDDSKAIIKKETQPYNCQREKMCVKREESFSVSTPPMKKQKTIIKKKIVKRPTFKLAGFLKKLG
mmetsp:Transcript_4389/g.5070  ORF Transcript_4389/g.5070 Transcript_4389/m.5070 type:complete len:405 (-) Transcript_4389:85-1299(-)